MLRSLCTAALLLFSFASLQAGYISTTFDSSRSVSITFKYTTASGALSGNTTVGAGPFNVTYSNTLGGPTSTFQAFCVDLLHSMPNPTNNIVVNNLSLSSTTNAANYYGKSLYADAGNRIAYLLNSVNASTNYQFAALQAALWSIIDRNFTITGMTSNDIQVKNLMNNYLALLSGYNAATNYAGTYIQIDRSVSGQANYYQNLATKWAPGGTNPIATPAPSSAVLSALGIATIGVFQLRKRRKTKA